MFLAIRKLKLHFYYKKTIQQARKFSLEELKTCHKIFETDLNIKTGKIYTEELRIY
jgi:hypothetical protein